MKKIYFYSCCLLLCFQALIVTAQDKKDISGEWTFVPSSSNTQVAFYDGLSLRIGYTGDQVQLVQQWTSSHSKTDSMGLITGGKINQVPVTNRVWPAEVFIGLSMIPGSHEKVTAQWKEKGRALTIEEKYPVLVSQGTTEIESNSTYTLSEDGQLLTLIVKRSTRTSQPLKYVFRRKEAGHAYYMKLQDNWQIDGLLPDNAFLISLQGIANTKRPNLYFVYPDNYDYQFTPAVYDFYQRKQGYTFTQLASAEEALKTFRGEVKGYIIWDKAVRTSLNVAFTLAGLEKAVVITPEMLPMVQRAQLKEVADFRNRFTGMSDADIFSWAYGEYWHRCSKQYVVWMGGVTGNVMLPGIADFGISKGAFFTDLSTQPKDTAEYTLADKIFSQMDTLAMVMGWHSYAKDLERHYVTLASKYGLRVEGLNTFPNLSFTSRTPPSPGFQFRNNHNLVAGKKYTPQKKTYITCVQSDGLGLGGWGRPGHGSIPYAWEVTINWQWMCPTLLEYYYSTATPNDFFIGSLSGPGYMYPKAIPEKLLQPVFSKAYDLMHKLDLNVFETMDYSQGSTVVGNTELPQYLVNAYYKAMPDAIGFVNGYAAAYTFDSQNGRPFLSYDYYLDETRPVNDAVEDLKELVRLNRERPYFLLIHVREFNDIDRVKRILDQVGPDAEVVPLDIFLKMAGSQPTFKTRFQEQETAKP